MSSLNSPWLKENKDQDSDGDGISDFEELYKYFTNPRSPSTDGLDDGDWDSRREHTYSIRSVVEVLKPIDISAMNTDYQDARVVSDNGDSMTLEVLSYPLTTIADAIGENPNWYQDNQKSMKEWLEPGVTTNWDNELRKDLIDALEKYGLPRRIFDGSFPFSDRSLVQAVTAWLLMTHNAKEDQLFITDTVNFINGKAEFEPSLRNYVESQKHTFNYHTDDEALAANIFGKQMFYSGKHGSCTPSAILIATVLKAIGIPTRIILTIPAVDSNDPSQLQNASVNLHHNTVKEEALNGFHKNINSYASHTYNEVFIGGRWIKLNYTNLGQNNVDPQYMGLMIQVRTMKDWSEAGITKTWGIHAHQNNVHVLPFASQNPYANISMTDHFGSKTNIQNPVATDSRMLTASVKDMFWETDAKKPAWVKLPASNIPRLFLSVEEFDSSGLAAFEEFRRNASHAFILRANGSELPIPASLYALYLRADNEPRGYILSITPSDFSSMASKVTYTLEPQQKDLEYKWLIPADLTVIKP